MPPLPKTYNLQQTPTNDKPNKQNEPVKLNAAQLTLSSELALSI